MKTIDHRPRRPGKTTTIKRWWAGSTQAEKNAFMLGVVEVLKEISRQQKFLADISWKPAKRGRRS